jgi:chaperonin GroES
VDYSADFERKASLKVALGRLQKFIDATNVADLLDDDKLAEIGKCVVEEAEIDDRSRDDWRKDAEEGMKAALQAAEVKNWPFENSANIKYPLITVAALQFNARAYPAIVADDRPVKAKKFGADPDGQKQARAGRVSEHMSYQLMEEMVEWEGDTDTLLMQVPIVGDAFRKVYYDASLGRNRSEMVPAVKFIVNQAVRSLEDAPRYTHELERYPQEIEEKKRAGVWLDVKIPAPNSADGDKDAPRIFYEQHRFMDLDEDGYGEPYIVTVHKESAKVVRIVANYGEDDIEFNEDATKIVRIAKQDYFVQYPFIPDPGGGFYGIGFYRLLKSLNEAINTALNQIFDAGTLQTAGGGFIGSGVRFKTSELRMKPGVYKTVDAPGGKIREAIVNMEHPGPSAVLFHLLGLLIEAAKDITSVQDLVTGDSGNKVQQPTTVVALIEQGLKVFTAIYKRIYRALKREFKLLQRLNAEHLTDEAYQNVLDQPASAKEDYTASDYDVCPTADPKSVTDMQRMGKAQLLMGLMEHPNMNAEEALREILGAAQIENVDRFVTPTPTEPPPMMTAELENKKADTAKKQAEATKVAKETEAGEMKDSIEIGQALGGIMSPGGLQQPETQEAA